MKISYKNKKIENTLIAINAVTAIFVAASFALLFGFHKAYVPERVLYTVQATLLCVFVLEKTARFVNARIKSEFVQGFWFEIPLFVILATILIGAGYWFKQESSVVRHSAIGIYLIFQVIIKVCRSVVNMAATGRNPTKTLILTFVLLIVTGATALMLPKSATNENISFIDALFTSTSATCVTGLIVKDTGSDFSVMGQTVILTLIQLGGLGIVVFGAVFAIILGTAFSVREQAAMQDLLSAKTLGKLGKLIAFIFAATILFEAIGALILTTMWNNNPEWTGGVQTSWFYSIFHSISAFCNAGFSLFENSFIGYHSSWQIYAVICPLIILGGLGFGVLYDLWAIVIEKIKRLWRIRVAGQSPLLTRPPLKMALQSKIVIITSLILIIVGALLLTHLEHTVGDGSSKSGGLGGAMFQSITARTAGFNTVDIAKLSPASQFIIILLMFIGGSPGSTAGGIKTVTFAVLMITAVAALRKRSEVELFQRSIRISIVGRAITVTLLFAAVLFIATLLLTITEHPNEFAMGEIFFESASALGTVGLSTGITPKLTTAGKLIIIIVMLIGRLGPLTLLASLTFNIKPAKFNYPDESVIVG